MTLSKKDWIDKAFKDAVDMPKCWSDPDNPQKKRFNSLFRKEFEPYLQKESKVKPCKEKVDWWCETPTPKLRLRDILVYIPENQPIVLRMGEKFLWTTPFKIKREKELLDMRLVSVTISMTGTTMELEVENDN